MAPPAVSPKATRRSRRVKLENAPSDQELAIAHLPAKEIPHKTDKESAESFRTDLDKVRTIVTCTICDQLLYEPWTLACGHTYCYSCLCSWFLPNKRKKSCPDCRSSVKQVPAPAFLIKQMVDIFVERTELMPADETLEQHQQRRKEENGIVEADKISETGLFKGCFVTQLPHGNLVFNEEDRLYRCSRCGHEYTGGLECEVCELEFDEDDEGVIYNGLSDHSSDFSAESLEMYDMEHDLDHLGSEVDEFEDEDAEGLGFTTGAHTSGYHLSRSLMPNVLPSGILGGLIGGWRAGSISPRFRSSDSEEDAGSLHDFIDDDEDSLQDPRHRQRRQDRSGPSHRSVSASDSGEDNGEDGSEDEDSDEGGAISNRSRPRRMWTAARARVGLGTTRTSASTSDAEDTGDEQAQRYHESGWSPLDNGGESEYGEHEPIIPVPINSSDGSNSDTETIGNHESDDEDDEDDEDLQNGSVTPRFGPSRVPNSMAPYNPRGYNYTSDEDNDVDAYDSDVQGTSIDREGDVEMSSASPEASSCSRSVTESTTGDREASVEFLGTSNNVHEIDDDSSDASVVPAVRRRRRQQSRNPPTSGYNPRISEMFAQHQSDLRDVTQRESPYFDDYQRDSEHARETAAFLAVAGGEPPDIRPRGNANHRVQQARRPAVSQLHSPRVPSMSVQDRYTAASRPVILPSSSTRPNRVQRQYYRR